MPKGLITAARDAIMPILFAEWNKKAIGSETGAGGDLGFLNMQTRGVDGGVVTASNYESQIAANRGPVHAALRVTAQKVGAATLRIYRPITGTSKKLYATRTRAIPEGRKAEMLAKARPGSVLALADNAEEIVAGHRLIDLITNVNSQNDIFQLQNVTAAYLGLTGNCYWVLIKDGLGIPTAIWIAPAEFMRVIPDVDTLVAGYVYKHGQLKKAFGTDEVIHFKSPAPGVKFQFYGRGDLMGAADDFNLLSQMYAFEGALFLHGGVPATILSTQSSYTEEEKVSFRKQFEQRFGGSENAGKAMVTKDVKVEQLGMAPREMAYQGARKFTNDNIYTNMGVPVAMMTNQINSRAALDASIAQVSIFTIDPMLKLIEQALNAQLIPLYKDPIYVEYDNVIPEDREFELKEDVDLVDGAIKTINEVRKERGLDPVDNGDVAYINMNKVPLGTEVSRQPTQAQVNSMAERAYAEARRRVWGNG
jgi:HK97 family phage portal protein